MACGDKEGKPIANIVARRSDAVYKLAFSRLRNAADAEDVRQTVFLRLCAAQPSFEDGNHEKAWLLRVAVNLCNDVRKSGWHRFAAQGDAAAELAGSALADAAMRRDVEREAQSETTARVESAPEALTPVQRTVVHLYYYEDYSTDETACVIDARPSTVRSHLRRARKRLERELREVLHGL